MMNQSKASIKKEQKRRKSKRKYIWLSLAAVAVLLVGIVIFTGGRHQNGSGSGELDGAVITAGIPTAQAPELCKAVALTHAKSWQPDSGLPGVNATPVAAGDRAYVLYFGGPAAEKDGGARIAAVSLSDDPKELWSVQIDKKLDTDNIQQAAAPYYDETAHTLYVPVTYSKNILAGKSMTVTGGSLDSDGYLHLTAGQTCTVTIPDVTLEADSALTYIGTGITVETGQTVTGDVTFHGSASNSFGESYSYWGSEFILYNNGGAVSAGTYTVTVTITPSFACTGSLRAATPCWRLYTLGTEGLTHQAEPAQMADGSLIEGMGQFASPITAAEYNGHTYLYFGVYDGDSAYYQYDLTAKSLTAFRPEGSGFYEAGAAALDGRVVFGSESGKLYSRPMGDGFADAAGAELDLTAIQPDAGAVRSRIRQRCGSLYLTTGNGYLWRAAPDLAGAECVWLKNEKDGPYAFGGCSSPVISESGRVYVNVFRTDWTAADGAYESAVQAVSLSRWDSGGVSADTLWVSGEGVAQAAPVVYYDAAAGQDYVYFTVKSSAGGRAVCLTADTSGGAAAQRWSVSVNGGMPRGFAVADGGYMVLGSENNQLIVLK